MSVSLMVRNGSCKISFSLQETKVPVNISKIAESTVNFVIVFIVVCFSPPKNVVGTRPSHKTSQALGLVFRLYISFFFATFATDFRASVEVTFLGVNQLWARTPGWLQHLLTEI
jgi:hypothetical protein